MASSNETGQKWKARVAWNRRETDPLGKLEVGVEDGTHVVMFEGDGLIVDTTREEGEGGVLTSASGRGSLGFEIIVPQEAQLRKDPDTGEVIHPTHQARVVFRAEMILTPLDYGEVLMQNDADMHTWLQGMEKAAQERGDF